MAYKLCPADRPVNVTTLLTIWCSSAPAVGPSDAIMLQNGPDIQLSEECHSEYNDLFSVVGRRPPNISILPARKSANPPIL